MKNILKFLNKSYPIASTFIANVKIIMIVGFFVGIFIFFLKPFGLINLEIKYSSIFLLGYGLVTSLVLFFNLIFIKSIFQKLFIEDKWTVLKNILWLLWIISTIGFANYLYSSFVFSFPFTNRILIGFQIYTLLIGIIPVTIITLVNQNNYLKKNIKEANSILKNIEKQEDTPTTNKEIELFAENGKDKIKLELQNLLFLESSGNYVEVNYLEDEKLKTKLLRSSLKRIHNSISDYSNLFKSHRAFIINIDNITNVKGNAQGYQISMKNSDKKVPISRNFIEAFKEITS